ncbi:UDP-3-O-acyl-N-acetylglucosamine deacetylase [Stenomitos frigidus]|uniref:UDP-3-O-acyl-N-acetylglucosamine deacetylase n=1 Tax=Stenomitos frigidus ULC18 TaxID=2107698 RepID=A0A2T1E2U3_9CYAN|nr:UDP-3-O-[3-hydroxymyristoyl] N-acetylglucosamine deacetylase [Stenomitos frigidus ULC18]
MEREVKKQEPKSRVWATTGVVETRRVEEKPPLQHTLKAEFVRSGVGLHTGLAVQVRVLPAPVGRGRYFARVDKPGAPEVSAQVTAVRQTTLSTELAQGEADVRTVEHLLAALAGMGVANARIEIDGSEVPLLDGSAKEWVEAIAQAGTVAQTEPCVVSSIEEPLWIREGDAFVAALPSSELRFTYGIDFALSAIGKQWYSWSPEEAGDDTTTFAAAIAPARTFGLAHQIEALRDRGLIKGGTLDNALVCGSDGWLNPPLRFLNEPVRHKLLDLVGDLSLLGDFPTAHFLAYKASHHLHTQLARAIAAP